MQTDSTDADARKIRFTAARALGQRTTSANAGGGSGHGMCLIIRH